MTTAPIQREALDADGAGPVARRLSEPDRPALLGLLLRLSDDDRRMRFMSWTTDASIAAYVAACDLRATLTFGIWSADGVLVAVAEGSSYRVQSGMQVEIAFTTDPAWRRLGLARLLLGIVMQSAAAEGYERIVAQCDVRNAPMRSLLRTSGAEARVEESEVSAAWPRLVPDTVGQGRSLVVDPVGCPIRSQPRGAAPRVGFGRLEEPSW